MEKNIEIINQHSKTFEMGKHKYQIKYLSQLSKIQVMIIYQYFKQKIKIYIKLQTMNCLCVCGLTILIIWIALGMVGYYLVVKVLSKYSNLQPIRVPESWNGITRNDYHLWNRNQIKLGAFFRFPKNVIIILGYLMMGITMIPMAMILDTFSGKYSLGMKVWIFFAKLYSKYVWRFLSFSITQQNIPIIDTPIVISNHVCWFDILYLIGRLSPISFISKEGIAKIPLVGTIAKFIQTLFVSRSSEENKDEILKKIEERIKNFEQRSSNQVFPLLVFPQGTVSNGHSLLRFKLGAFLNKSAITMVCLKYKCQNFQMGMDEIQEYEHLILSLCLSPTLDVKFKKMVPLKQQSPQQYMNRCQDQMSKLLEFKCYDCGFRQRNQYKKLTNERLKKNKKVQ